MLINFSPYGKQQITPYPVVPADNGWIYFAKKGFIEVDLMPISLQQQQEKQAKILMLLYAAAENLAKEREVSAEEAYKMLFEREVDGVVIPAVSPISYLSLPERQEYLSLGMDSNDLPVKIATLIMQNRFMWSIQVSEAAKAKSKQLSINTPWFAIEVGSIFNCNGQTIVVTDPYDAEGGFIGVEPLAAPIAEGSDCFLMEDRKTYKIGFPEWTEERTRAELSFENADGSQSAISRLQAFYLLERGLLTEADVNPGEEKPGKRKRLQSKDKTVSALSSQELLTGVNSTGESSLTESVTNGLAPDTLELVPHG